tara:strand:+ start:47805 stop:48050 length:246 start_codon:yes stop_codon:yes gene_type:complete
MILLILLTLGALAIVTQPTREAIRIIDEETNAVERYVPPKAGSSFPWLTRRTDAANAIRERRFPNSNIAESSKGKNPYFSN